MVMSDIPDELSEPRCWTAEDCQKHDFRDVGRKPAYMTYGKGSKKTEWLHARYISPQENHDAGRFEAMTKIRDHFLDHEYQKEMLAVQANKTNHLERRGTGFDLSWAVPPHHAGIRISKIAQKHESNTEILKLLAEVNMDILGEAVPELNARGGMYLRQWAKNAAMTFGSESNVCSTSAQVNVSKLGENLGVALKGKGKPHMDINDVPTYYTVLLFLSNPPPEWYEGKFVIYSTRVFCEGATFGALVFSSKHPHSSQGFGFYQPDLPQDLRYTLPEGLTLPVVPDHLPHSRVAIPIYCRSDAMKPRKKWLKWLTSDTLPEEAIVVFGTKRNLQEWGLRFFINIRSKNDIRSADEWCDAYT
ncbi:uncharacterized protein LY89DRAFT_352302 [Mollisia scopiformis]|uniref:Uncharacterized protein n=1 Tax=Mollisia scopiformis TaxID=149040 RepID=A0A132B5R6_MOLSC|nr:uncharacterized protein LY89DRAFT_352302 [Mollisia scopiformis]KUJ07750.1 hypothetical protein LY89DRAFT_352302 [Mollisia scopiformis]